MGRKSPKSTQWEVAISEKLERMHGLLTGKIRLTAAEKKRIREATKHTRLIRKKLQDLQISLPNDGNGLPTDLGDIYEICHKFTTAIQVVLKVRKKNIKDLAELLSTIDDELYIHLPYHLKHLRKPLDALIDSIQRLD